MRTTTSRRLSAVLLSAALVATGAPAFAADGEEEEPVEPAAATLWLSDPGATLTLPDGDGVRDTTTMTLESDVPTTVTVEILDNEGTRIGEPVAVVDLADGALVSDVTLPVAGLPAGNLTVRATPTAGAPVSSWVIVGSGTPATTKLSVSPRTFFTWSKSTVRAAVASMWAKDETGLTVPFTGVVIAKAGGKTQTVAVSSLTGATAKATLSGGKLAAGAGTVQATLTAAGVSATTSPVSVTVKSTAVSATKLSASLSTIYPTKDGYRDSVKLTVKNTTTTGGAVPASGSVTVTSKGKTVKSWALSSSKTWSASWDGKVKGKVVPGTYTVTARVKGPEGATKTSSAKVVVKKGKLVTKTTTKTVKAKSVLKKYRTYDYLDSGYCETDSAKSGDVACIGYDTYYDGVISVLVEGGVSVPSAVVSAQKYGSAKVRMSAKTSELYGAGAWAYGAAGSDNAKTAALKKGSTTAGWVSLPATTRKVEVALVLGEYSFVYVDTFTISYSYKVMSTT